jgi:hypothetical protein
LTRVSTDVSAVVDVSGPVLRFLAAGATELDQSVQSCRGKDVVVEAAGKLLDQETPTFLLFLFLLLLFFLLLLLFFFIILAFYFGIFIPA